LLLARGGRAGPRARRLRRRRQEEGGDALHLERLDGDARRRQGDALPLRRRQVGRRRLARRQDQGARPGPNQVAPNPPQVAITMRSKQPLVESALWVDDLHLFEKGGGSTTNGTIYGAPANPLEPGTHVAVGYARAPPSAARSWRGGSGFPEAQRSCADQSLRCVREQFGCWLTPRTSLGWSDKSMLASTSDRSRPATPTDERAAPARPDRGAAKRRLRTDTGSRSAG
jgi:hypothetical protein